MNKLIGPHEGKELALLDSGEKHVALFYEIIPDQYYSYKKMKEYCAIEFTKFAEVEGRRHPIQYAILYRKCHRENALRLAEIIKSDYENYDMNLEREIGRILCYSNEAIEAFIAKVESRPRVVK